MNQKDLIIRTLAACMAVSSLTVASTSIAATSTYASAVLKGTADPAIKGWAKRVASTIQQSTGSTLSSDSFDGSILIPLPNIHLDITNATAQETTMSFVFSRKGTPFAECNLDLKSIQSTGVAEYKVTIKNTGGYVKAYYGVCDTNLAKNGLQLGVPNVQTGDEISAESSGIPFAYGVMTSSYGIFTTVK